MNILLYVTYIALSVFVIVISGEKIPAAKRGCPSARMEQNYWGQIFLVSALILVFAFLCGTRSYDSYDTYAYVDYLERMNITPFLKNDGMYRTGFEFFTKIYALLGGTNYVGYFVLIAAVNSIIVFFAVHNSQYRDLRGLFIYFGFLGFYYNYIIMRQSIALSFVILAYSYFGRSRWRPIVCSCIAMLFHESALIALAVILFTGRFKGFKKRTAYVITVVSLLLYITKWADTITHHVLSFIYPLMPAKQFHTYILYLDSSTAVYDISIFYLLCYGLLFFSIYKSTGRDPVYNRCLTINILGQAMFSLFSSYTIIGRLCDYLSAATFIFIVPCLSKRLENKKLVTILIFLSLIWFFSRIILGATKFF